MNSIYLRENVGKQITVIAVGLFVLMASFITHASVNEYDILYDDPRHKFVTDADGTPQAVDEYIKELMADDDGTPQAVDEYINELMAKGPWVKSSGGGYFRNR